MSHVCESQLSRLMYLSQVCESQLSRLMYLSQVCESQLSRLRCTRLRCVSHTVIQNRSAFILHASWPILLVIGGGVAVHFEPCWPPSEPFQPLTQARQVYLYCTFHLHKYKVK